MARREGWVSRRHTAAYKVKRWNTISTACRSARTACRPCAKTIRTTSNAEDPVRVWIEYYYHLTPAEREKLLAFLMREA